MYLIGILVIGLGIENRGQKDLHVWCKIFLKEHLHETFHIDMSQGKNYIKLIMIQYDRNQLLNYSAIFIFKENNLKIKLILFNNTNEGAVTRRGTF